MPDPGGEARQILLVDDSGVLERELRDDLVAEGFDVASVASGGACLRRVKSGDLDGIVSEYALPDLDGVRLVRSIRVSYPMLPFVLVADEGSETLAGDAVAAGVSGYVPQNDDPETTIARLRDSLERADRTVDPEQHHRYRHIIEMSPAPINLFDGNGESIWCNQAVVELLDLDAPEDLIGRSIFEFIHPDDRERAREELAAVTENKESTGPTRMKLRTADGAVRYIHVSTAIGDFLGEDIGQAIVVDVTDRVERERQMKTLERWLRHNIRNEVTVIHGMAEAIEHGVVDDVAEATQRIREHAAHLVEQADHERRTINLLTDPSDPEPTDLAAVVEQEVAEVRDAYPDAETEISTTGDVVVAAIPEIDDAIGELLENAVQHNDADPPSVRVGVTHDDSDRGVVSIADNGPGIPDGERTNLLVDHEFSQLDHGTGLGLIFVNWAMRLSEGTIAIGENDPRGSVVTLTFRARKGDYTLDG